MEFELRQENISIVIMPLPFVYTTRAVEAMKVKPNLLFEPGITSEVRNIDRIGEAFVKSVIRYPSIAFI